MKLKILTFSSRYGSKKIASVLWMLLLALALVLVDYFLSPVITENGWSFIKITVEEGYNAQEYKNVNNNYLPEQDCKNKDNLKFTTDEKQMVVQACLKNGDIFYIKESDFKGILMIYQYDKLVTIAKNLHQPKLVEINIKGNIFIWEEGRKRLLKFYFR